MPKKILIISTETNFSYANPNSAVAKYLNTLADSLESFGFSVQKYPPGNSVNNTPSLNQGSKLGKMIKKVVSVLLPRLYATLILKKKIDDNQKALPNIFQKSSRPDLILEFLSVGSHVGAQLKAKFNIPLVIIYDAPLQEQFCEMNTRIPFNVNRIDECEHLSMLAADHIVVYSQAVFDYVKKKFSIQADISILPCIIWKNQSGKSKIQEQYIGFIGSFLIWHKVDLLVKAFELIAKDFPDAKLALLGYGQEWKRIHGMVEKSEFSYRIEMPGFVSEEQLFEYKRKMLIGVMPGSNWYGSPLKLFEYAESSIAIIAPETPTVKGLFNENEVLFINSNNSLESLVDNMRLLLGNETKRLELVQSSFEKMNSTYSKLVQMRQFNEVIEKSLQRGVKK